MKNIYNYTHTRISKMTTIPQVSEILLKFNAKKISDAIASLEEKGVTEISLAKTHLNTRGKPHIDDDFDKVEEKEEYELEYKKELEKIEKEKDADEEEYWRGEDKSQKEILFLFSRYDLYLIKQFLDKKYYVYIKGDMNSYTHIVVAIDRLGYCNGKDNRKDKYYYFECDENEYPLSENKHLLYFLAPYKKINVDDA